MVVKARPQDALVICSSETPALLLLDLFWFIKIEKSNLLNTEGILSFLALGY